MFLMLFSLPAMAWPSLDSDWVVLEQGGSPLFDPANDLAAGGDGYVDLVGSSAQPLVYWMSDGTDLMFRIRIDETPLRTASTLQSSGWAIAFDLDSDLTTFEYVLSVDEGTGFLEVRENDTGTPGAIVDTSANAQTINGSAFAADEVRVVSTSSTFTSDPDFFMDIRVEIGTLKTLMSISESTPFSVAVLTGIDSVQDLDADVSGTGTLNDLSGAWTDVVGIDQDGDGLTDAEEGYYGTDPLDWDSDDDGLSDYNEIQISTDPWVCDTDGDGLPDGLERGATTAHSDTDLSVACFIADTDPLSKTSANEADNDRGGVNDGVEDRNSNGAVDTWEIDPNLKSDDVDTDGDGIWDALEAKCDKDGGQVNDVDSDGDGISDATEGLGDPDGDGLPNFCDSDSDGDGIDDEVEGEDDTDGDDIPDYLDTDSDGDGKLDEDEGEGDTDGDGVPNYEDPDDGDGPTGDGDNDDDGLSNAEENDCGSDPENPDTDGDGVGDLEEGPCDEDSDCDGIPDWNDPTDDDLCEDDTATDDTAVFPGGTFTDGHFTGGSCNSIPMSPGLLAGLFGLVAMARRRRRRTGLLGLGLAIPGTAALLPSPAQAQDGAQTLNAQRYRPAMDGQRFFVVNDSQVGPAFSPGGGLVFNYADDPFVFRYNDGRDEVKILESVGTADLVAWMNLPRARIGLDLPLHAISSGYGVDGFRLLGDARIIAAGELIERGDSGLGIGVSAWLDLPTGNEQTWLGEAGTTGGGSVLVSYAQGPLLAAANLGASKGTGQQLLDDLDWGNRLDWSAGLSYMVSPRVDLSGELSGEYLFKQSAPGAHPAEFIGGLRYHPSALPLVFSLGAGTGVTQGIGAPDWRGVGGVIWAPTHESNGSPTLGGDRDGDGVLDEVDLCPDQAEDFNGVDDADGCPDGSLTPTRIKVFDQSGNQVADAVVDISSGPETGSYTLGDGELMRSMPPGDYTLQATAKGYESRSIELSVPEGTTHAASVRLDKLVAPGTVVVSAKNDEGLPVAVSVRVLGDTPRRVPAASDGVTQLELPPGSYSLVLSADGYANLEKTITVEEAGTASVEVVMQGGSVRVEGDRILILKKVYFELDSAQIKQESLPLLDEVAATLINHPELLLIEVQGHTDERGGDEYNMSLSADRADSVKHYLVSQGVAPERLATQGYGEGNPLSPNHNEEAWAMNRRVEFHINKRED